MMYCCGRLLDVRETVSKFVETTAAATTNELAVSSFRVNEKPTRLYQSVDIVGVGRAAVKYSSSDSQTYPSPGVRFR